jgi:charged multivesicular body protein 4
MQQEQVDEQMLNTGQVPVADAVHKLPTPSRAEREYTRWSLSNIYGANIQKAISSRKIAVAEDDEEAELLKLQAEMAM